VFVWQPVPSFKYDLNYHFLYRDRPFAPGERVPYEDIGRSYVRMAEMRSALESRSNFLWLADIQANRCENLYVDRVHYSAKFSQEIADEILKFLRGRGLLPCSN
jgi:hypothetical protein